MEIISFVRYNLLELFFQSQQLAVQAITGSRFMKAQGSIFQYFLNRDQEKSGKIVLAFSVKIRNKVVACLL